MHVFKDCLDRRWEVTINVAALKRVRGLTGTNLADCIDKAHEALPALMGDMIAFVDVLFALCKGQADEQGITDESFAEGLANDAFDAARDAFMDELVFFCPNAKARVALKNLLSKSKEVSLAALAQATAKLDSLDVQTEASALLKRLEAQASNGSSGGVPAVSA